MVSGEGMRDYGNQRAVSEIGLDKGRSEGNGELLRNLILTGHRRGGELIDAKHLRHENELGEQTRSELRVHDVPEKTRSPNLLEGCISGGL